MNIRQAIPADGDILFDRWLRSVKATHTFVAPEDIEAMAPHVRIYLCSASSDLWVVCDDAGTIMGFMGLSGNKMDALFLAPEFHGRGAGQLLVRHAQSLRGQLTVDVNEQNEGARRFYVACGFTVEGRSALDEQGRPYPLLHMRLLGS